MNISEILIRLVSSAVCDRSYSDLPVDAPWHEVFQLSLDQGVVGIAFDGIQKLSFSGVTIPLMSDPNLKQLKYDWFGSTLDLEQSYERNLKVVSDLADFYTSNGINMMLLKGVGLSQYYPVPAHRPTGDIDIYLFGKQKEADRLIAEQLGIKVKTTVEHHTVFSFEGTTVENHYDFINTKIRKSGRSFEELLKGIVGKPSKTVIDKVYVPDPQFNMLFLMKHMSGHFASEGISLRHVLDWALFVKNESDYLDWVAFFDVCREYNTDRFVSCINAICVDYLGFAPSLFPVMIADKDLEQRVFDDIMSHKKEQRPQGLVSESLFRLVKWFRTRWKQRICYRDSFLSSFWTSLTSGFVKASG